MNLTKEDEEDYLNFCSEAMFRIHILELRLNRFVKMFVFCSSRVENIRYIRVKTISILGIQLMISR